MFTEPCSELVFPAWTKRLYEIVMLTCADFLARWDRRTAVSQAP